MPLHAMLSAGCRGADREQAEKWSGHRSARAGARGNQKAHSLHGVAWPLRIVIGLYSAA